MTLFTYAQIMEDIILYRALKNVPPSEGFYIDVGGYHPTYDSVTKVFYDLGWHGVNIEPGAKYFPAFEAERPRDINLRMAISDHVGEATFFEMDQTSTLETRFANRTSEVFSGEYTVPIKTLTQVCEEHVSGEIHFLKIDVEGHEAAVVRGMDFKRFRPWVMLIEAVEPNRLDRATYHEWEAMVLAAGYTFAFSDVLNRYYVANEHKDLLQYFGLPADDFLRARDFWRTMEVERQRDDYERRLKLANEELLRLGRQPL